MSTTLHELWHSLRGRLALASLCLLPIILGTTGSILDRAFVNSLLAGEREQLRLQAYLLLGSIEFDGSKPRLPLGAGEPMLNQQSSGLYAYLLDAKGQPLWQSPSSRLQPFQQQWSAAAPAAGQSDFKYAPSNGLSWLRLALIWEDIEGNDLPITVLMQRDHSQLRATLEAFRRRLWQWLGALGGALVLSQLLVLRWGLTPLRQLALDIAAMETGQSRRLQHNYPREIRPLTTSINRLLDSEQQQRERYRHTMADLAHSLKTPLAIMLGLRDRGTLSSDADEPLQRMTSIIEHQLQRATQAAQPHNMTQSTPIAATVQRLGNSLDKVYRDQVTTVTLRGEHTRHARIDERDLMEILGNLLDNAYKYGGGQITVDIGHHRHATTIAVHDDGPGLSNEQSAQLCRRGQRADCHIAPGQGIGLAVVCDIVAAYGGRLDIMPSPLLGGAQLQLTLPD